MALHTPAARAQGAVGSEAFWTEIYAKNTRPVRRPRAGETKPQRLRPIEPAASVNSGSEGLDLRRAVSSPIVTGSIDRESGGRQQSQTRNPLQTTNAFVVDAGLVGPYRGAMRAATGEQFDHKSLIAAHDYLPLDTSVLVTDIVSGRAVVVRVKDRQIDPTVAIELSRGALAVLAASDAALPRIRLTVIWQPTGETTFFPSLSQLRPSN